VIAAADGADAIWRSLGVNASSGRCIVVLKEFLGH